MIQRVGSSLDLDVHAHSLMLDGVYAEDARGTLVFRRSKPGTRDGMALVEAIARSAGERRLPARCASFAGYTLHAGVAVRAGDRAGLERLARCVLRGPLAKERLERRGGEVVLGLKRAWSDRSTALVMSSLELAAKLVSTVPPPRANTVVYHGIFAAAHRRRILSRRPSPGNDGKAAWAELLRHTFGKGGFACPSCGRAMEVRSAARSPSASRSPPASS